MADILPSWDNWAEVGSSLRTCRITQVVNGHGCFGEYLRRIGAEGTAVCHHCGAELDSQQHTVEECEGFVLQRRNLVAVIGPDLSPPAIVEALLAGSTNAGRLPCSAKRQCY